MKNFFSSIIKETVHGKSTKLKNRAMLMKHINEDLAKQDYNPKTARHKSLKEINLPGFKLD